MSTTLLEDHGQSLIKPFNHKRNKVKALLSLRGILQGITADTKLKEVELLFLDVWLKTDSEYKNDGDFLDLRDILEEILDDGYISADELEDIQNLMSDVIEYGYRDYYNIDAMVNQLLGFLQGITSDDKLHDKEILKLKELLENHSELTDQWPGDVIYRRINSILEDGIVDDDERSDLLNMLTRICGQQFSSTGSSECSSTDFFAEEITIESIEDKKVCFTGKFISGTRKNVETAAKKQGAEVKNNVTQDLDYLVIGSMASRDWKFTSHGRKIEAVINNQRDGHNTRIITEETWIKFIG